MTPTDKDIIAAFSAGAIGELSDIPTHQPHAPLLVNEQIVWVVRRFLVGSLTTAVQPPIPMVLTCPKCGAQHIDKPQPEKGWTNPPHRSHECQVCSTVWRPADVETVGVEAINTRGKADTWP